MPEIRMISGGECRYLLNLQKMSSLTIFQAWTLLGRGSFCDLVQGSYGCPSFLFIPVEFNKVSGTIL